MEGKRSLRLGRISHRRPLPPPPKPETQPVPHTPKKSVIAITGTRPDRLCAVCLGRLEPGATMTICECGKLFHMACIADIGQCPICGHSFGFPANSQNAAASPAEAQESEVPEDDVQEIVYQCPVCFSYVPGDATSCSCGAVFDTEEEVYLCPGCSQEVEKDAAQCPHCGMEYG